MSMQAFQLSGDKGEDGRYPVVQVECPVPKLRPGRREALVRVSAAALNHRDNWMTIRKRDKVFVRHGSPSTPHKACARAIASH